MYSLGNQQRLFRLKKTGQPQCGGLLEENVWFFIPLVAKQHSLFPPLYFPRPNIFPICQSQQYSANYKITQFFFLILSKHLEKYLKEMDFHNRSVSLVMLRLTGKFTRCDVFFVILWESYWQCAVCGGKPCAKYWTGTFNIKSKCVPFEQTVGSLQQ